jgi:hypothetical protein
MAAKIIKRDTKKCIHRSNNININNLFIDRILSTKDLLDLDNLFINKLVKTKESKDSKAYELVMQDYEKFLGLKWGSSK